ncbi:PREDICTED: uncharacterized protein LOC109176178 isoform X2 [Ipomoea nil]|nr:PREDICTED: uncharacterized protein LOC109176178 isoform X2 [Ipomoea nil]
MVLHARSRSRTWYYMRGHGRRVIQRIIVTRDSCSVQHHSLNDAMHAFNRLRLDSGQVLDNPNADRDAFIRDVQQRSTDMLINTEYEFLFHVALQQYFGDPMLDEPFGPPMPDEPFGPRRHRDRPNMRGGPTIGGLARRAVNQQLQAELVAAAAAQKQAEAEEETFL